MTESAWIDDGGRRFFAAYPLSSEPRSPAESAISRLIQGIYAHDPTQARRILRHRILATTSRPTEMCWGMVRVAAKRLSVAQSLDEHPLPEGHRLVEIAGVKLEPSSFGFGSPPDIEEADPMGIALALTRRIATHDRRSQSARQIAAVLTDEAGKILAWAINSSAANKTLHAEVNLVQAYCRSTHGPLPRQARLYTTLKSCKMCAGLIWTAAADPLQLQIHYAEHDSGPKARLTVLNAGSFERERVMPGSTHLLELQARSVMTNL